jgi:hypothetical protein
MEIIRYVDCAAQKSYFSTLSLGNLVLLVTRHLRHQCQQLAAALVRRAVLFYRSTLVIDTLSTFKLKLNGKPTLFSFPWSGSQFPMACARDLCILIFCDNFMLFIRDIEKRHWRSVLKCRTNLAQSFRPRALSSLDRESHGSMDRPRSWGRRV